MSRYSDLEYDNLRKFIHILKNLGIPWTFLASYPTLGDVQGRLSCHKDHKLRLLSDLGKGRELAVVDGLELEDRDDCEVCSAPLSMSSFISSFVRAGARNECR